MIDNVDIFEPGRPYDVFTEDVPKFRDNIYWSQKLDTSMMQSAPVFPGKKDWSEWTLENDFGSAWVDPMFVNADGGDYSFKSGSPATAGGFEPIVLGKFGIQPDLKQLRYASNLA